MTTRSLSFTARDVQTITAELLAFIKETRPDVWSDFFESNLGVALVEQIALVGDMISYGQDVVGQEIFLSTCRRYESALRFARSVGYISRSATPATVLMKATSLPDALVINGGTVPKGSTIKSAGGLVYELLEDVNIAAGDSTSRIELTEGQSYVEQFEPTNTKNQTVRVTNGVVADGSWEVYVGLVTNPANLWTQVDNVQFEDSATNTYDIEFDGNGRLKPRFGDGIAGKIPDQVITVNYRTCSGAAGNAPVGSIKGSIKVNLNLPATGTVSVAYENRDTDAATSTATQLNSVESVGSTLASVSQSGVVAQTPVVSGSLQLTISLPSGGGILVLQDTGAGSFSVASNTTGRTVLASVITYSTGAFSVTLNSAVAAGGPMTATYSSIESLDANAAEVVGAAQGGEDRESLAELKENIPAYIRSQDKIVTLQDFNDVVTRVPGVSLVFADVWVSSYSLNAVKVHVWTEETSTFVSEDSSGVVGAVEATYVRYAQVTQSRVNDVLAFLKPRTLLTVQPVIFRPQLLWVDLYLGDVEYDKRYSVTQVRQAIVDAVVGVFQNGTGFIIRLADIYNAVRDATGVNHFIVDRIATGTLNGEEELQGTTTTSPTVAGTLLKPICTPGSLVITVEQTSAASIVLVDNGAGALTLSSGVATLNAGTVDYRTGAWTATFAANLIPNQRVIAAYANVTEDYRHDMVVTLNAGVDADAYPPPGVSTTIPITTPPYKDGLPESALRASDREVLLVNDVAGAGGNVVITETGSNIQVTGMSGGSGGSFASGRVIFAGGLQPLDTETVTISDGVTPVIFEFDNNAAVTPGRVLVTIGATIDDTRANLVAAINAHAFTITASAGSGSLSPAVSPYQTNDQLTYKKLKDITVDSVLSFVNFYNDQYLYNNEIYYDSIAIDSSDVRAIVLRRLVFNLQSN